MNHLARTGADPVPLDFNAMPNSGVVADAPVSDATALDASGLPVPDAESLLAELGLSALAVREILTSSSAPDF